MPGTLACPGTSGPTGDGKNCAVTGNQDCGSTAAPNPSNQNLCYFQLPPPTKLSGLKDNDPASWNWQLTKGGEATFCLQPASVEFNNDQIDSEVWWSGGVFARVGCQADGTYCVTGDCSASPNANCPAGKGGTNPATLAEFTLQRTQPDFYDISAINGVNVSEEMVPQAQPTQADNGRTGKDYWCKAPGARHSAVAGKDCSWDLAPYVASVPLRSGPSDETSLLLNSTSLCSNDSQCDTADGFHCTGPPGSVSKPARPIVIVAP